jgi:tRNA modification GTPase
VLWIQDVTDEQPAALDETVPDDAPVIVVHNKIDLVGEPPGADDDVVRLSAKTGEGIDDLRTKLRRLAGYRDLGEGAFTARRRHLEALRRAAKHFETGRKALDETRAGELLAEELRLAQEALGEITGAVSSDDLLGRIFSEFCIGK